MPIDPFSTMISGKADLVSAPARRSVKIVAGTDLTEVSRGLYVGTAGDISLKLAGDSAVVTWVGVAAGVYPLQVLGFASAGSTASNLIALY